jgi:hypothetical protein
MTSYTVTLSDNEDKSMRLICNSIQEWIDNAIHERAKVAEEEVLGKEIKRRLDKNLPILTKEELLDYLLVEEMKRRNTIDSIDK